ncbi:cobyrinate a,c-diamide synthase [Mycolicibacterium sp. ELW1]|uniref:cobyrinate a,c-diamide synthase n=1 Tax=Mycobacteriaceae TaxID=1762 RepID=UPI0011EBE1C3|nr:cobyrinate a,c-diamide synthase [Mycobacterium sp. ELW1]QEN15021.1 cobyrinate a,c-diamide synthase [Mycobacterium sp. ELW1]
MTSIPAVIIGAPASGSGKTTVATGLIGALRAAGHRPAPFKVGPDFIDPGYHAVAAGRPGRNLDPVLVPEELIGPLYRHGSRDADIAVIEGVMGLFDGRIDEHPVTPARGSTAHVAQLLGAPVVLVVDARGQSQSIAAVLQGFSTFHPGVHIGGVILNRVGTNRHEQVLRQACEAVGVPVLGSIPRHDELAVPSRHLGLITAVEHGEQARAAVSAMTELVARHVDLPAVVTLGASRVPVPAWTPEDVVGDPSEGRPVVAMAAGKAFSFGYAEHRELLRAAGAQVVEFDPLSDSLPARTAALILPGGFPEQHLADLSANSELRAQIHELARHAPVQAECGGLAYLMDDLDGHPMCGVLAGSARFTPRLTLGYREAVAVCDSSLYPAGQRVVGHEFHRTTAEFTQAPESAWAFRNLGGQPVREGAIHAGVHASYLHTHPVGQPHSVARFVAHATLTRLPR